MKGDSRARLRGGLLEHARLDAEARGQREFAARHGLALRDERVDAREQLRVLAARKALARLGELGQRRLFVGAVDEVDALHAPLVRGEPRGLGGDPRHVAHGEAGVEQEAEPGQAVPRCRASRRRRGGCSSA
jgi:hypothetical protein